MAGSALGQIVYGEPASADGSLIYQSWSLKYSAAGVRPETTLTQSALPLHVFLPVANDWEVHVNSAYSRSHFSGGGTSESITSLGAPALRVFRSFSEDRLYVSGGLLLPLGKTKLDEQTGEIALSELISSDYLLLPVKQVGHGLGLLVSFGGADQYENLLYGGSVTYYYRGSYTYAAGSADYNPGDEFGFRGSATLPLDKGRLDFDLGYKYYLEDKLGSEKIFKNGDQFSLIIAGHYDFNPRIGGKLSLSHIRRAKDSRRSGAVFNYELHNSNGDKTVAAGSISYQVASSWRGAIMLSYRFLGANDWEEDHPAYFGDSDLFRIGAQMNYRPDKSRYGLFGRVIFATGNADDSNVSITGTEIAVGGQVSL
jgi:hypothetical protein